MSLKWVWFLWWYREVWLVLFREGVFRRVILEEEWDFLGNFGDRNEMERVLLVVG